MRRANLALITQLMVMRICTIRIYSFFCIFSLLTLIYIYLPFTLRLLVVYNTMVSYILCKQVYINISLWGYKNSPTLRIRWEMSLCRGGQCDR